MAKFYGPIGYVIDRETSPGVWMPETTERCYYGDVNRMVGQMQTTDQVNDDLNMSNKISIVADPFANMNVHCMRYVAFMGAKWKITSIEVNYPRLILTIGGVYNGK